MARPVSMNVGDKFGMLTVIARAANPSKSQTAWVCQCECGSTKIVRAASLRRGHTKSCGCSTKAMLSASHKKADSIPAGFLRNTWASMNARCHSPSAPDYDLYGGKGITVCPEWRRPHGYWNFVRDMGPRPAGKTLDRIDTRGDYTPNNCRWADRRTQQNNRRCTRFVEYNGVILPLGDWSRRTGIPRNTLWNRLYLYGWPAWKALGYDRPSE